MKLNTVCDEIWEIIAYGEWSQNSWFYKFRILWKKKNRSILFFFFNLDQNEIRILTKFSNNYFRIYFSRILLIFYFMVISIAVSNFFLINKKNSHVGYHYHNLALILTIIKCCRYFLTCEFHFISQSFKIYRLNEI